MKNQRATKNVVDKKHRATRRRQPGPVPAREKGVAKRQESTKVTLLGKLREHTPEDFWDLGKTYNSQTEANDKRHLIPWRSCTRHLRRSAKDSAKLM